MGIIRNWLARLALWTIPGVALAFYFVYRKTEDATPFLHLAMANAAIWGTVIIVILANS